MTKARDIASAIPAPSTVSSAELGYLDGVTSAIQTQLDAKTAKSTLTTTGDIYYASSANTPARLGIGSTGNVLTVAGGVPSWAAPAGGGGGKVLQVVNATVSTAQTITSTSDTDVTDLAATITPSAATSKILILVTSSVNYYRNGGDYYQGFKLKIARNGTVVISNNNSNVTRNTSGGSFERSYDNLTSASYIDSPSSTSALTYKVQSAAYSTANSGNITWQNNNTLGSITLLEIGA